jgi:hypothetical protein
MARSDQSRSDGVYLYWIPLGAGSSFPVVRWSGAAYESVVAWREHRNRHALFHAALEIYQSATRYTLEMTPAWGQPPGDRGVVTTGPVGLRALGSSRLFRYEVRCWPDGEIPDLSYAVGGAQLLASPTDATADVLRAVRTVPAFTWGRDVLRVGDMWNSNSVVAFVLATSGVDVDTLHPPADGRAPGWHAGIVAAGQANASTGGHEQTK